MTTSREVRRSHWTQTKAERNPLLAQLDAEAGQISHLSRMRRGGRANSIFQGPTGPFTIPDHNSHGDSVNWGPASAQGDTRAAPCDTASLSDQGPDSPSHRKQLITDQARSSTISLWGTSSSAGLRFGLALLFARKNGSMMKVATPSHLVYGKVLGET
jgi:hypothetical protein